MPKLWKSNIFRVVSIVLVFAVVNVWYFHDRLIDFRSSRPVLTTAEAPNILIVFIDTLRYDSFRGYNPESAPLPKFDSFFSESVVYSRAHSTAPWTLPAYASLLTGLYPHKHSVLAPHHVLEPDVNTLAEQLQHVGYDTAAFVGGGFTSSRFQFEQGFDRYNEPEGLLLGEGPATDPFQKVSSFLRSRKQSNRPFFALTHTYQLHDYFKGFFGKRASIPSSELKDFQYYNECLRGTREGTDEDWRVLRALYTAVLKHLDEAFGHLMDTLEDDGLAQNTIVVLVSDHGEGFEPASDRTGHGGRMHEDQIRIPLAMRVPGVAATTADDLVSIVDVMPTLLEWVGVPAPMSIDGISLVPTFENRVLDSYRRLVAQDFYHYRVNGERMAASEIPVEPLTHALISERLWYIRDRDFENLYDMARDPGQRRNLLEHGQGTPEIPECCGPLMMRIPSRENPVEDDAALLEQLRSLGYTE